MDDYASLQFCANGQDITGDFYAGQDATEVRAWEADGTCLGAVTLDAQRWRASASDVCSWTEFDGTYSTWQDALHALLTSAGMAGRIDPADWSYPGM